MIISEYLFESAQNSSLEILKTHFPQCFDKQGNFLPEKMAEVVQSANIHISREYYNLNWLGKNYARYLRDCPPTTLLAEDTAHNAQPQNQHSQNLLIKGDNLEVLKHLVNAYKEKIKMIYIDPPYNTGSDGFVYQDDRKFTPQQLAELADMSLEEAQRILDFTAKKSNSHSAWLTFMYPRLYIARELLKKDGVIFISIDDNEQAQLKLLCDEVFGEENFVADVIWQRKRGRDNSAKWFSKSHEYVLVYTKLKANFNTNLLDLDEETKKAYKNQDNDPRGNYRMLATWARGTQGGVKYDFISKNGQYFSERLWLFSKDNLTAMDMENRLIIRGDNIYRKLFLTENKGKIPETIWSDVSNSANASDEIKELFDGKIYFDTAKPIPFLTQILKIATKPTDIILDFFAGSGTTAHAVMQLNAQDNGSRQFICVQLPEATDKQSEAYKAGYHTILDITKARIEKSAVKIRGDFPDFQGDLGFKIFETVADFRSVDEEKIQPTTMDWVGQRNKPLDEAEYHTLLTTWRIYDGNPLTESVQAVSLGNYFAHLCGKNLYLIQPHFESAHIKALLDKLDNDHDFLIERIMLFGANIESAKQMELKQALDTYSNKKNLHLSLLVRY